MAGSLNVYMAVVGDGEPASCSCGGCILKYILFIFVSTPKIWSVQDDPRLNLKEETYYTCAVWQRSCLNSIHRCIVETCSSFPWSSQSKQNNLPCIAGAGNHSPNHTIITWTQNQSSGPCQHHPLPKHSPQLKSLHTSTSKTCRVKHTNHPPCLVRIQPVPTLDHRFTTVTTIQFQRAKRPRSFRCPSSVENKSSHVTGQSKGNNKSYNFFFVV